MQHGVRSTKLRGFKLALVVVSVLASLILLMTYKSTMFHPVPMSFIHIITRMSNRTEPLLTPQMRTFIITGMCNKSQSLRSPNNQSYADPWSQVPEFELFLRMFYGKKRLYEQVLVQSMKVFWPTNIGKMVTVLDDESPADHKWATNLTKTYPCPRVMFEKPSRYYHNNGHSRQQFTMFHADMYTTAEYVGFIDTDTIFVTPVTPSMLFEGGKPVVIGQIGVDHIGWWLSVSPNTALWFKHKEVMKCMSYFPVMIKVQHIVELRKRVEQIHNKPFDEVYEQLTRGNFSQFSIMCQFLWMYHRNDYKFYFENLPNDKWTIVKPGRVTKDYYQNKTVPEQYLPRPRAAAHWGYPEPLPPRRNMLNLRWFLDALTKGFCYSLGIRYCPQKCPKLNNNTLQRRLYLFEGHDWSWHPACLRQQHQHFQEVDKLIQYYNDTHQPVLGADTIEDACNKWPLGYKFTYS